MCAESEESDLSESTDEIKIILEEIKQYQRKKYDIKEDTNPLEFYSKFYLDFPFLSQIARRIFNLTATSVPSESLFSKVGDVITKKA